MVHKISGKHTVMAANHLNQNNTIVDDVQNIVNALGTTFCHNSSSGHYTRQFQQSKNIKEKKPIKFQSDNLEIYNKPLPKQELTTAINNAYYTAVGPDDIHYQMLKHLPDSLQHIFNDVWICGKFPPNWHEAKVIPWQGSYRLHKLLPNCTDELPLQDLRTNC